MQSVVTHLVILLLTFTFQAQNTLEVTITGFSNNHGKAVVGLYDSENDFLNKSFQSQQALIENNQVTVTFTNVPDGDYAISMFHDENDNDELDMFMGFYPKETYGCSNNAKGRFGPPKWQDAVFSLSGNQTKIIEINL